MKTSETRIGHNHLRVVRMPNTKKRNELCIDRSGDGMNEKPCTIDNLSFLVNLTFAEFDILP